MNKYIQKGFTLIEILIVITIIGVLVAFLLPNLTGIGGKTNDLARKKMLNEVVSAVEMMHLETGAYPAGTFCIDAIQVDGDDETTLLSYLENTAPEKSYSAAAEGYCPNDGNPAVPQTQYVYYQKLANPALGKYAVFMLAEDSLNYDHAFTDNGITDTNLPGQALNAANPAGINVMAVIK